MKLLHILLPAAVIISSACTNHTPPEKLINTQASLPESFNFSKMGLKVISSSINKKMNTMSTIYGNEQALQAARSGEAVKSGEVLARITWSSKEDEHWFGANIPDVLQTLEMIRTSTAASGTVKIDYQCYEGRKLVLRADTSGNQQHIRYIFAQHPSVMP